MISGNLWTCMSCMLAGHVVVSFPGARVPGNEAGMLLLCC